MSIDVQSLNRSSKKTLHNQFLACQRCVSRMKRFKEEIRGYAEIRKQLACCASSRGWNFFRLMNVANPPANQPVGMFTRAVIDCQRVPPNN